MKWTVMLPLLAWLILCVANSSLANRTETYYVAPDGDDNNICFLQNQPCKSIRAAVDQTAGNGYTSYIHIARGTYAESNTINITAGKHILFSGGWSNDFTEQQCQPGNTIVTPAGQENHLLFSSFIDGADKNANVGLRCLTLDGKGVAGSRAIWGLVQNGGALTVNIDHVQVTGCTGALSSTVLGFVTYDSSSSGTITMRNSIVTNNPGSSEYRPVMLRVGAYGSSSLDLDLDRVMFADNGAVQTLNELSGGVNGSSRLDILARNCLFSHRYPPSNAPVITLSNTESGTLNLSLLNTTAITLHASNPYILGTHVFNTSTTTLRLTNTLLTGATGSGWTTYIYQEDTAAIDVSANYSILGTHEIHADDQNKVTWTSTNEVYGDPRLDTSGHLKKGSAAIDAGICGDTIQWPGSQPVYLRIAPYEDMDGNKRPGDGAFMGCDIGADEFHAFPWPAFLPAILPHQ